MRHVRQNFLKGKKIFSSEKFYRQTSPEGRQKYMARGRPNGFRDLVNHSLIQSESNLKDRMAYKIYLELVRVNIELETWRDIHIRENYAIFTYMSINELIEKSDDVKNVQYVKKIFSVVSLKKKRKGVHNLDYI